MPSVSLMARMVVRPCSSRVMTSGGIGGGGPSIMPGGTNGLVLTVDGIPESSPGSEPSTTRLGAVGGAATTAAGGIGADRRIGGDNGHQPSSVALPASASGGDVGRARDAGRAAARPGSLPVPLMSSVASRSCSVKRSSMAPSTFAARTIVLVVTSTSRPVMRSWSPSRWYPPLTTHRAPKRRPTSRAIACSAGPVPSTAATRIVSATSSGPITSNAEGSGSSAARVSAMPAPIQSSPGAPLTLTNGRMATRSGAGARGGRSTSRCAVTGAAATRPRHEHRHDDPEPEEDVACRVPD